MSLLAHEGGILGRITHVALAAAVGALREVVVERTVRLADECERIVADGRWWA